jgi:hypothetical protein
VSDRQSDTDRFYLLLDQLAANLGGLSTLRDCTAAEVPSHGVYFFYETAELRVDSSPRVVRIGTHALTLTSHTKLWTRLAQHRGRVAGAHAGGGDHRGSIFRHHVGTALLAAGDWQPDLAAHWRDGKADRQTRNAEFALEQAVSDHIRAMPLLWLHVSDRELRQRIERNSIALLSCRTGGHDHPSNNWLGLSADSDKVRTSGLWNVNHVDEPYDTSYLDDLNRLIDAHS